MQWAMLKTALKESTFFAERRVCGSGSYAVSSGAKEMDEEGATFEPCRGGSA